jgi:Flp pilus assembly pilin Flp
VFRAIRQFFQRNDGQDLAEYCLLAAFIGLVALGIIIKASGGIQGIWTAVNTTIATAPGGSPGSGGTGGGQSH